MAKSGKRKKNIREESLSLIPEAPGLGSREKKKGA